MKTSLLPKCLFWIIFAIGLLVGMGFRVIWGYSGHPWMFRIGDAVMGATLIFVGMTLVIKLITNSRFVYSLRSKRRSKSEASSIERYAWLFVGIGMILFGAIIPHSAP